jgi:hypothetical protein
VPSSSILNSLPRIPRPPASVSGEISGTTSASLRPAKTTTTIPRGSSPSYASIPVPTSWQSRHAPS